MQKEGYDLRKKRKGKGILACGLMAALVMYWKVDLSNSSVVVTEDNMEKIDA